MYAIRSYYEQEKSVPAPVDAMVKRVLKDANYQEDRRMVPVKEGELLVELGPVSESCPSCGRPVADSEYSFCPRCGGNLENADPAQVD